MKLILVACLAAMTFSGGCTEEVNHRGSGPPSPSPSPERTPARRTKPQTFDRLTMALHLGKDEVQPGGTIRSQVEIKNDSDRPVTDPGCLLQAFRFALVPADDPDAELWGQVVVDCSGPFTYGPGHVNSYRGPTFHANDKFGDPLPVGDYLAVMELEKRSQRFVVPVSITE